MNTTLSETQKSILIAAAEHPDHRLDWFPDNLKGGVRAKVLGSLQSKGLVEIQDGQQVITRAGLVALGLPETPTEPDVATTPPPEETAAPNAPTVRTMRENTKQATLVDMLKSENGATLQEMIEATGWKAHSIRGFLAGTLKQKLGLTVVSDKIGKADRVYRVA